MTCRNGDVVKKLNYFYETKKIPNIIFHGSSGSGKRTIMNSFLSQIYDNDIIKIKTNVMMVNCSHGKGIKFIRDELKFFAKTNIKLNDIMFKSIVLLNADSLTIDAQSALRRCIELFSFNTRFFIIVENKHKLLNPILSRFCEIYIPGYDDTKRVKINLHSIKNSLHLEENQILILEKEIKIFEEVGNFGLSNIIDLSTHLYEGGFYTKQVIDILVSSTRMFNVDTDLIYLYYYKLKKDFRCEKMLLFYILKVFYFNNSTISSNDIIKNMLII
jgi:DNA polymerase III delta prime subunit